MNYRKCNVKNSNQNGSFETPTNPFSTTVLFPPSSVTKRTMQLDILTPCKDGTACQLLEISSSSSNIATPTTKRRFALYEVWIWAEGLLCGGRARGEQKDKKN